MNKAPFNVREYVSKNYNNEVLERLEESLGINGLDLLWGSVDKEEVDNLLEDFID